MFIVHFEAADLSWVTEVPALPRIGDDVTMELKPWRVSEVTWHLTPKNGGGASVTVSLVPA